MIDLATVRRFLQHGDWANEQIVAASVEFGDDKLDAPFDMGVGSLRKTLLHILAGEDVWLQRWMGRRDTPWPDESEKASPRVIGERLRKAVAARGAFERTLKNEDTARSVVYRDSKGSLYQASLGDMMLQMILHSAHHRSQAVNMLRRLGAKAPELDYMYHVRVPAGQ